MFTEGYKAAFGKLPKYIRNLIAAIVEYNRTRKEFIANQVLKKARYYNYSDKCYYFLDSENQIAVIVKDLELYIGSVVDFCGVFLKGLNE